MKSARRSSCPPDLSRPKKSAPSKTLPGTKLSAGSAGPNQICTGSATGRGRRSSAGRGSGSGTIARCTSATPGRSGHSATQPRSGSTPGTTSTPVN